MSYQQWGNSTWYLFHGLSHKLKIEHESFAKEIALYFLKISNNLPCDHCSDHASKILRQCNINNITTKEVLKDFIWKFHNIVNKELKKPLFSKEERDILYEKININNIIYNFEHVMKLSNSNSKAMMGLFKRKLIVNDFIIFLKSNLHKFDR